MAEKSSKNSIRRLLEKQRQRIVKQIEGLRKNDPFFAEDRATSNEAGTDASEIEGHDRTIAMRGELSKMLDEVKKALSKIGVGTYGKCENCGNKIERARLKIKPEATLCLSCEMKQEKKIKVA